MRVLIVIIGLVCINTMAYLIWMTWALYHLLFLYSYLKHHRHNTWKKLHSIVGITHWSIGNFFAMRHYLRTTEDEDDEYILKAKNKLRVAYKGIKMVIFVFLGLFAIYVPVLLFVIEAEK